MEDVRNRQCPACREVFLCITDLVIHMKKFCLKKVTKFTCCDDIRVSDFRKYWSIVFDHLGVCTDFRTGKMVTCCHCNAEIIGYKYPLHLQKDILLYSTVIEKSSFTCDHCQIFLPSKIDLESHKKLHLIHDEEERKFKNKKMVSALDSIPPRKRRKSIPLDPVEKSFDTRGTDLVESSIEGESHIGRIMYPCGLCSFESSTYEEIVQHVNVTHNSHAGVKWKTTSVGKCYKCMATFKSPVLARIHVEHCGEMPEDKQ